MKVKLCLCLLSIILCGVLTGKAFEKQIIDKIVEDAYKNGSFSGVVLVSKNDSLLYQKNVGQADRQWNFPNSLETKFRICSITKQFTAMLVMQFVERKIIDLDKAVADYLHEFGKETASRIKVRDHAL